MLQPLLYTTLAAVLAAPVASATDGPAISLYRGDEASLYSGGSGVIDQGYAVVHETRRIVLEQGAQTVHIAGLPALLDPEAVALSFPADAGVSVKGRRMRLPGDAGDTLRTHLGEKVTVIGNAGQQLAAGTLTGVDGGLAIEQGGNTILVHDYAAVQVSGTGAAHGARLALAADAARAGAVDATLTYPTSGLGWRAAYSAQLAPGEACRMRLDSEASIANRSGRDWQDVALKLIAGEPHFAKNNGPHPVMMKSMAAEGAPAPEQLPFQATLGDYRSYTIDGRLALPDGSVTLVPLYAERNLDCQRTWLYENGNAWTPPKPMLSPGFDGRGSETIVSTLQFKAFDSLPAGYIRVLDSGGDGYAEFLGEDRIPDTPKSAEQPITVTLGNAFDLRGQRERRSFHVDKGARRMDEAFRITLSNSGDSARTVTVREHPSRWRNWTLQSSSQKPDRKTTDTMEFRVMVPAQGKAQLDYAVRYTWTAADE